MNVNRFAVAVLFVACVSVHQISAHGSHADLIEPLFKQYEVVPDVLDIAPINELIVTYDDGVAVHFGDELTPRQVKDAPVAVDWKADANSFYTLIMTDPDAPSRKEPIHREWNHWLVVNIPGNNVAAGDTLSEYVGAGPPPKSGLHRYVLVVYKQDGKHEFGEPIKTNRNPNRGRFNTRAFAAKHGLGNPVAGNLFQAQWDDYVPTLYAQFEH